MIPKSLGPYDIVRQVGAGGMGTVFEAIERESGDRVAVKVLATAYANDEAVLQRFVAEIDTLTKLSHPKVVKIFGYGQADGFHFYAMELVDGLSLREKLKEVERYSWQDTCRMGIELCVALKHAHDRGIVHRDLKPANIILDSNGGLKLADFGIARVYGSDSMTMDGALIGTPDYLSPEQAAGERITQQSDLYSLGCVFYALLTGVPPFKGRNSLAVIQAHIDQTPVPVDMMARSVPEELNALVMRLLSKQPSDRLRTAFAVSNQLSQILANEDSILLNENSDTKRKSIVINEADATPHGLMGETIESSASVKVSDDSAAGPSPVYTKVDTTSPVQTSVGDPPKSLRSILGMIFLIGLIVVLATMAVRNRTNRNKNALATGDATGLYRHIKRTKLASANLKSLGDVLAAITEFQTLYPDDARIKDITAFKREVEYFHFKAELPTRSDGLSHAERACQQAVRLQETDLFLARSAFLEVESSLGNEDNEASLTKQQAWCQRLARAEAKRIEAELESKFSSLTSDYKDAESSSDYETVRERTVKFVKSCPEYPRVAELQSLYVNSEIDLYRSRIIERVGDATDSDLTDPVSVIESRFVDALRLKEDQPGRALDQFRHLSTDKTSQECQAVSRFEVVSMERDLDLRFAEFEQLSSEGIKSLTKSRGKLQYLVKHFAGDSRCQKVAEAMEEIRVNLLPDYLVSQVQKNGIRTLSPIRRAYYQAMVLEDVDPLAAAEQMEGLIELYENFSKKSTEQDLCVRAAKLQVPLLTEKFKVEYGYLVDELRLQLENAKKLSKADPITAQKKYRAIIHLYGEQTWARDLVEQTRMQLARLTATR